MDALILAKFTSKNSNTFKMEHSLQFPMLPFSAEGCRSTNLTDKPHSKYSMSICIQTEQFFILEKKL